METPLHEYIYLGRFDLEAIKAGKDKEAKAAYENRHGQKLYWHSVEVKKHGQLVALDTYLLTREQYMLSDTI